MQLVRCSKAKNQQAVSEMTCHATEFCGQMFNNTRQCSAALRSGEKQSTGIQYTTGNVTTIHLRRSISYSMGLEFWAIYWSHEITAQIRALHHRITRMWDGVWCSYKNVLNFCIKIDREDTMSYSTDRNNNYPTTRNIKNTKQNKCQDINAHLLICNCVLP